MIAARILASLVWLACSLRPAHAGEVPQAQARIDCEPREAQIGEPVHWTLTVQHPQGATVHLPPAGPVPDDSWVLLESGLVLRSSGPGGEVTTRASWSVCSLEPGERALPALAIEVEIAGARETVTAETSLLTVRPALAPDEDAPRPMRGFLPPPESARARSVVPWMLAILALVIGIAIWRWRVRARRKVVAPPAPTPLERLAELRARARAEPDAARAITYSAAALLREAVDAYLAEPRVATPDADWIVRIEPDERVPLGVRSAAARILRDVEKVKYALVSPTPFALEELLASVESALAALKDAPPLARPLEEAA